MKRRETAILLALFTGILGFHRFYLRQWGLGILYLMWCWTFIPAALGWIDALFLILRSEEHFQNKYNSTPQSSSNNASNSNTSSRTKRRKKHISPLYIDLLKEISEEAVDMLNKLDADKDLKERLSHVQTDEKVKSTKEFIRIFMINDMVQMIKRVAGHSNIREDIQIFGGFLAVQRILPDQKEFYIDHPISDLEIYLYDSFFLERSISILWDLKNPMTLGYAVGDNPQEQSQSNLSLPPLFQIMSSDLLVPYATLLYRFALVLCKHDAVVTAKEEKLLKEIYEETHNPIPNFGAKSKGNVKKSESTDTKSLDQALKELHELIGLTEVKEEIQTLVNFVKIQQQREKEGLKTSQISYHIVFTGNPGTGKTTVARLLAQIYKELGLLSKGHLVETDRSGLIAEYAGQTAVKVNKVVDEALDGVLFIDEAYALVGQNKDDYGKEAVATLIKRMEDDRDRLIVILAGYSNEMNVFIETNPGFKSRINRYIDFRDYAPDEMLGIFELFLKKSQYKLSAESKEKAKSIFELAYAQREKSFGNGRFVRNIFEQCLENQANRLSRLSEVDRKTLMQIEPEDIQVS